MTRILYHVEFLPTSCIGQKQGDNGISIKKKIHQNKYEIFLIQQQRKVVALPIHIRRKNEMTTAQPHTEAPKHLESPAYHFCC